MSDCVINGKCSEKSGLILTFAENLRIEMIRKVREDDAAAIAGIYRYYVEETTVSFENEALSADAMLGRIRSIAGNFPYFVYEGDGGRILGYCYAHPWKERPAYFRTWETTIYLDRDAGRHGIGTALMATLTDACRAAGAHALIACITAENEASIAFHRRLGFGQVSLFRQVGFKFGRYLDVADLELLL